MCIYCNTTNYRKIYENHYGPIPKEENGRSYEIHHLDGNHHNNDPKNLKAVRIQEHYDIHYSQGDWSACLLISRNMKISPDEKSSLAKLNALRMVENGTHPFLSGEAQRKSNAERISNGTHHWVGPAFNEQLLREGRHPSQDPKIVEAAKIREKKRLEDRNHRFLDKQWQIEKCKKAVENKTHNFLGGKIQSKTSRRRVKDGTHNLLRDNDTRILNKTHHFFGGEIQRNSNLKRLAEGKHPSQLKTQCEHCGKTCSLGMYKRWHGDKCKFNLPKINNTST
jgi:hypothetical protein